MRGVPRIPSPRPAADDLPPHAYRPPREDSGTADTPGDAAPDEAPAAEPSGDGPVLPSDAEGTRAAGGAGTSRDARGTEPDARPAGGADGKQATDDGHVPSGGTGHPPGATGAGADPGSRTAGNDAAPAPAPGAAPGAPGGQPAGGSTAAGSTADADGRSGAQADGRSSAQADGRSGADADGRSGAQAAAGTGGAPDASGAASDALASHSMLKSLLGAWALSACSAEETAAVEEHLGECAPCADEALRLRDAVGLLHTDRDLDLDPLLRFRVLENCLGRRPARIPVPDWADPYDAETARLDALLRDIGESEWHAPVRLKWFEGGRQVDRRTTVAGVIGHLMTVDGLVSGALGLDDPLGRAAPVRPAERTEAFWSSRELPPTRTIREPWRDQSHALIRTVSFASRDVTELPVSYGAFTLPLRDSLLDRAFECWIHADDIADAVDYPYAPPSDAHLNRMIDLAARLLPAALAERRRAGLAGPARDLVAAGAPGRSLHLEVEGSGGGNWYIALDSPAAVGSPGRSVAQVALDGVEFCRLVAGHVPPEEAAAGQDGDREAIRDVLFAAASLSRL